MAVVITLDPFVESADPDDATGLTTDAFEAIAEVLEDHGKIVSVEG